MMKRITFILLSISLLIPKNILSSECSSPRPEWYFYSCWDEATGTDKTAILDGSKWAEARPSFYHGDGKQYSSVVDNAPPGGPAGNAVRIDWREAGVRGTDIYFEKDSCHVHKTSGGLSKFAGQIFITISDWVPYTISHNVVGMWYDQKKYGTGFPWFRVDSDTQITLIPLSTGGVACVDQSPGIDTYITPEATSNEWDIYPSAGLPNPFYMRMYFYADSLMGTNPGSGRKFMYTHNSGQFGLFLYNGGIPGVANMVLAKSRVYDNNGNDNHRDAEHLTPDAPWPGKETDGRIALNSWHSIEYASYIHPKDGWVKVWVDGKLAINASGSAFDAMGAPWSTCNTRYCYQKQQSSCPNNPTCAGFNTGDMSLPGFGASNWFQLIGYWNLGSVAHTEYVKDFIISKSYIGPIGANLPTPEGLIIK